MVIYEKNIVFWIGFGAFGRNAGPADKNAQIGKETPVAEGGGVSGQ
jgi:hypothetical protein